MLPHSFALVCALSFLLAGDDLPIRPTAGDRPDVGILAFSIRDGEGRALPGRLTFLGADGPGAKLFPNAAAAPGELAVRDDIVYTLSGTGRITVPAGRYRVLASHGLEWSVAETELEIATGGAARFDATLVREIDTTGWVSADFHLHTLTHSGHGDADLPERVISIIGEGVEVAVATDHNHHTDYRPTIAELGATGRVLPIVGNEISTPLGHFNAFPVDPAAPVFPPQIDSAPALFRLIRGHDNGLRVRTLIQVNHPRWAGIDYFGEVDLDPVAGTTDSPRWSPGFDSLEVFNENAGWGYEEAGIEPVESGESRHSVLEDWFRLLDRGVRAAAVGNSDSHHVRAVLAGYPRNFLVAESDDVAEVAVRSVADAVRRKRLFTTFGPFVELTVEGVPMGGFARARTRRVTLAVEVQAASWVDVDRVIVVVSGDRVLEIPVPAREGPLRFAESRELLLDGDAWLALLVEGDTPLAPVVPDGKRPVRPLAVTNPVWIDADEDGVWTSPLRQAEARLAVVAGDPHALIAAWDGASRATRQRLLIAAAPELPTAELLALRGLADPQRRVRIAACGLIDRLEDDSLDPALQAVIAEPAADRYLRRRALGALADPALRRAQLLAWLDREGPAEFADDAELVLGDLPGDFVRTWRVAGYFDIPAEGEPPPAPEGDGDLDRRFEVRGGEVGWEVRSAREDGTLDLLGLHADPLLAERALAYAEVWMRTDAAREVPFTLGTDDGSILWVGGARVLADTGSHGVNPLRHYGRIPLAAGWNRVLLRVENGRGGFGASLRILDPAVEVAPRPSSPPARPVDPRG
jgi:hypothetical protein